MPLRKPLFFKSGDVFSTTCIYNSTVRARASPPPRLRHALSSPTAQRSRRGSEWRISSPPAPQGRNVTTQGGYGTSEEMCIGFIYYCAEGESLQWGCALRPVPPPPAVADNIPTLHHAAQQIRSGGATLAAASLSFSLPGCSLRRASSEVCSVVPHRTHAADRPCRAASPARDNNCRPLLVVARRRRQGPGEPHGHDQRAHERHADASRPAAWSGHRHGGCCSFRRIHHHGGRRRAARCRCGAVRAVARRRSRRGGGRKSGGDDTTTSAQRPSAGADAHGARAAPGVEQVEPTSAARSM